MASPALLFFGAEVRRARKAKGITQRELGEAAHYSEPMVGAVERGERLASPEFCKLADEALGLDGLLGRLRSDLLTVEITPEWFRPWLDAEREATALWTYELSVVPGLLQTEGYARAVLGGDDGRVAARLSRQEVLTRDHPPALVVLLDERTIRHPVGGGPAMREQLDHLAATAAGETVVLQVIPLHARSFLHLDGPFTVATVDGHDLVYLDTPFRGFVLNTPEVVSYAKRRWDRIRSEALSTQQSIKVIQEVAEQWA